MPAREFEHVAKGFWSLIKAIYSSRWDLLPIEDGKNFHALVDGKILNNYAKLRLVKLPEASKPQPSMSDTTPKPTIPMPLPPIKTTGSNNKKAPKPSTTKKSYAQASKVINSTNIEDVIRVKEVFPALSADEVGKMLKAKNSNGGTKKPKINMTTRGQSRREVIIPMTRANAELIVNSAHIHTTNVNKCLKNSNSNIVADFIHFNINGIIITTNKPASDLDLSTIEKYLKSMQNVIPESIESPHLPKSKSYMKIIRLPYSSELGVLSPDYIEGILVKSHLFKDMTLVSKPHVIKASPKLDKAVVWVDIWDSQSGSCVKNIINCRFNVERFIATVRETNMNPGVPQCKNYWKWGHSTLSCRSHVFRYTKCYGAHDTKHHREKAWCCMENKKTNRVVTIADEPCPYIFKCVNCKGDHQADSYSCPYWHNRFNRDWHSKKQQELFQK